MVAMLTDYAVGAETGGETARFPGGADLIEDPGPIPVVADRPPVELNWNAQVPIDLVPVGDLLRSAADGDQRAWRELVARFSGMIAAVGRRYGLSPADVNELQQTTWLRLVEHCSRIEHPERVGGWLATTARRESLQLLKRASRYTTGADELLSNLPNNHAAELDAGPLAEERNAMLRAGWSKLKLSLAPGVSRPTQRNEGPADSLIHGSTDNLNRRFRRARRAVLASRARHATLGYHPAVSRKGKGRQGHGWVGTRVDRHAN